MYFPIFVDLSEKEILVVGGGTIAARRVTTLCGFAGHITVRAPQIAASIRKQSESHPILLEEEPFTEDVLMGKDLVLAATDDRELNREIVRLCRKREIPVNDCSRKENCDFYFPSVVRKDELVIGINASGTDHGLVKRTRMELEEFLQK